MNQIAYLNELFKGKALLKLLSFFLERPSIQLNQKKLKQKVKLAKASATKWLKELEKKDFVRVEKVGVTKLYSLNKENPIIKQLKIINNLLSLAKIRDLSTKFNVKAYLYGSAARGEDVEDSDLDILIIGKIKREQIIRDINKIASSINRPIKIQIFSQQEWSQIARKDSAFYERVEKDKIKL
ncbi:MAG: nucleotidyltransferase domain-containing protein [Candidatus Pacearchaeota archaeon]|nr:MAG: nucleotidyltransferase domain-containing protein [Candidatus Pacearchaeota archaeon]